MFIELLVDFVFMRVYNGMALPSSEILNCEVWDPAHVLSTALAFIVNQAGGGARLERRVLWFYLDDCLI